MEDICNILIETYNVNKIDTADKELKDALYEEAKKCSDRYPMKIYNKEKELVKTNERLILMKLLKNHFDPKTPKPMPKFISGPSTLTVHKSPDEKRMIYIFGEQHTNIKDCSMFEKEKNKEWNEKNPDKMTIDYFLYELMKTTSAYLDIYFEFPAFKTKDKMSLGYHPKFHFAPVNDHMYNLFEKFKKCIGISKFGKTIDDCALARIHFFDSRRIDIKGKIIGLTDVDKLVEKIYYLNKMYGHDLDKLKNIYIDLIKTNKQVIYILRSLGEESTDEIFSEFWLKQLRNNKLINKETKSGKYKQRRNIEEIVIMKSIKLFIKKEIVKNAMKYRETFIELVTTIFQESKKKVNKINKDIVFDTFNNLIYYIIIISSIVADIYLLARLFKDFDMTKIETHSNFITDQPTKAHNVIIYAGNHHSKIYRRYLKEIAGFEEIASTGKIDEEKEIKHCIDMKTIQQPFFSTSLTKTPTEEKKIHSFRDFFTYFSQQFIS